MLQTHTVASPFPAPQVGKRHGAQLKDDDMVRITEANISSIEDSKVLIVADMDRLDGEPSSPPPAAHKPEPIKPEVMHGARV